MTADERASLPVHDAVVLAGGGGRRLGGVVKADVVVAGRPLLEHALDAVADARRVVVVGPPELARRGVPTVLEDPAGGGPVAGIDAGLTFLDGGAAVGEDQAAAVLVVACDVPRAAAAVPALFDALARVPDADGAHLVHEGKMQIVAVYRRRALARALAHLQSSGGVRGASVRSLVAELDVVGVPDVDGSGQDADTWEDVESLDARITGRQT